MKRRLCYQAAAFQVYGAFIVAMRGSAIPAVQLLLSARICLLQAKP